MAGGDASAITTGHCVCAAAFSLNSLPRAPLSTCQARAGAAPPLLEVRERIKA